jgi:hypothetical protein
MFVLGLVKQGEEDARSRLRGHYKEAQSRYACNRCFGEVTLAQDRPRKNTFADHESCQAKIIERSCRLAGQ